VLKASVNYTGRTSMEVGVRVEVEHRRTGDRIHTASAYLTFVCLSEEGKPIPVPPVSAHSEDEKRRYREAERRRAERLRTLGKIE
jgi:acyl-CoA hydrolase